MPNGVSLMDKRVYDWFISPLGGKFKFFTPLLTDSILQVPDKPTATGAAWPIPSKVQRLAIGKWTPNPVDVCQAVLRSYPNPGYCLQYIGDRSN